MKRKLIHTGNYVSYLNKYRDNGFSYPDKLIGKKKKLKLLV